MVLSVVFAWRLLVAADRLELALPRTGGHDRRYERSQYYLTKLQVPVLVTPRVIGVPVLVLVLVQGTQIARGPWRGKGKWRWCVSTTHIMGIPTRPCKFGMNVWYVQHMVPLANRCLPVTVTAGSISRTWSRPAQATFMSWYNVISCQVE